MKVIIIDSSELPAGVELLAFPAGRCDDVVAARDLCNRISLAIDHFVRFNLDAGESF